MIIEYYRPATIPEALMLLSRAEPRTVPMGGGTYLNRPSRDQYAAVDLQALHLNAIEFKKSELAVGATVTLQQLWDFPQLSKALKRAISCEATYNIRHAATLAGVVVSADGPSPLATVLLAQVPGGGGLEPAKVAGVVPVELGLELDATQVNLSCVESR